MASAWVATATPLTLARLRSGRFQPNPRSRSAIWGRSQAVDKGCRGSPPAPIGWARCPSGGPHEGACVDRTTDPIPGPGRLTPDHPDPAESPGSDSTGAGQLEQPPSGAVGRLLAAFGMEPGRPAEDQPGPEAEAGAEAGREEGERPAPVPGIGPVPRAGDAQAPEATARPDPAPANEPAPEAKTMAVRPGTAVPGPQRHANPPTSVDPVRKQSAGPDRGTDPGPAASEQKQPDRPATASDRPGEGEEGRARDGGGGPGSEPASTEPVAEPTSPKAAPVVPGPETGQAPPPSTGR